MQMLFLCVFAASELFWRVGRVFLLGVPKVEGDGVRSGPSAAGHDRAAGAVPTRGARHEGALLAAFQNSRLSLDQCHVLHSGMESLFVSLLLLCVVFVCVCVCLCFPSAITAVSASACTPSGVA